MNIERCFHCGDKFGVLEAKYPVRVQRIKFKKRDVIGFACETCVEGKGLQTNYHLWLGDNPK